VSFKLKPLTQHLLLAGLISISPLAAQAADNDADARIEKLEQQVNLLLEKLEQQNVQLNQQQEDIQSTKAVTKNAVIAKTNGRSLSFESADGDFKAQIGGRIQADAAFYDSEIPSGDGTDFRRLFVDLRGTVYKDWDYRFQYDFARPNGSSSTRGVRDAYFKYTGLNIGNITVGQFKAPFGLEHLTSSLNSTFLERGLNHVFTPDRRIGVGFDTANDNWTFAVGGFGSPAEESEDNSSNDSDEGWNLIGRLTATPVKTDNGFIHLGLAARQNWAQDTDGTVRFRERPEVRVDGARLVDTGSIAGVDDSQSYGLEFATVYGPFSVQSEYIQTKLKRDGASDLDFDGWYAYASYFLTGESRAYKNGIFDRTKPKSPVGKGGYGAWEVAARYSTLDLNDDTVTGGELDNATLGVNWYATDNIRFAANYVKVLDVDRPGNANDDLDGDIFAVRAQVDF
tara:strand:- start:28248 stop:29609 length:1362 start_codon:yes stop_codon:yes gene_type:complete